MPANKIRQLPGSNLFQVEIQGLSSRASDFSGPAGTVSR
jgi:hypothetical protein